MQFSHSAFSLLALAQLAAAFEAAKDSCQPEAHVFKAGRSPGLIRCTVTPGGRNFIMYKCGSVGNLAYDPTDNRLSIEYYKDAAPTGAAVKRINLYGSCLRQNGAQVAHISISTPLLKDSIRAELYPGFNRPCEHGSETMEIGFNLYDLSHDQLEQCYAHPIKPITN